MLLVGGATADVAKYPEVGVLVRPGQGVVDSLLRSRVWAVDNAAFTSFDAGAFVTLLDRVRGMAGCRFVVSPDVVGNAAETLRLIRFWGPMIRSMGFPLALAAQDGLTVPMVPWSEIDALFIGGTTGFKMSRTADTLLAYAAARGKWRHVGRVNSRRRLRHFLHRCDSVDGSGFSRWPKRIGLALRWMADDERQPSLREVA